MGSWIHVAHANLLSAGGIRYTFFFGSESGSKLFRRIFKMYTHPPDAQSLSHSVYTFYSTKVIDQRSRVDCVKTLPFPAIVYSSRSGHIRAHCVCVA